MADDTEQGDDVGWWNCSLCTFKNSADKFKCEICDLRRGTSTRKPRCNADTIVAQVVKQQEQIRQQTSVKASPKVRKSTSNNNTSLAAASSSDSVAEKSRPESSIRSSNLSLNSDDESDWSSSQSGTKSPKPKRKRPPPKSSSRSSRPASESSRNNTSRAKVRNEDDDTDSESTFSSDATDELPNLEISRPESPNRTSNFVLNSDDELERTTPQQTLKPIEVSDKLVRYLPPTSSGRKGLIIDKKRFSQHTITVNDVTITLTEFAVRQNNYIRKKKRQRDRNRSSANVQR